jgi:hypothetical protein
MVETEAPASDDRAYAIRFLRVRTPAWETMVTTFSMFTSLSLQRFLEVAHQPDSLWFFLHIPKTAGSSMSTELGRVRPPYLNISIDYVQDARQHDAALAKTLSGISPSTLKAARSASGHVPAKFLQPITQAVPDVRLFTILRDPVQRVLSDYVYQTTPAHPPFEDFKRRYPHVEDYVLDASEQDKMFFFASGERSTRDFDASYKEITNRFCFIGLTELYDMSFNIVTRLMGSGALPSEFRRQTSAEAKARVQVTPALTALIRQTNPLDQQLYERVAGALLPKLQAWQTLQAAG